MKSKRLLLTLLMALMVPWAAMAQETLTVYDGTGTNQFIPLYAYSGDTQGTTSEFVIPASALSTMATGSEITELTFYLSQSGSKTWTATYKVYLKEVEGTTLTGTIGPDNCTVVYTGTIDGSASTTTITFQDEYTYNGGNLLIGTYVSKAGAWDSNGKFYGTEVEGAAFLSGDWNGSSTGVKDFIPKTTFTYEAASTGGCEKPATVTASNIQPNSAMLNWEGGCNPGHGYNVEIKGGQYADWTRKYSNVSQGCLLNQLIENTAYQARVQVVCSANGEEPVVVSGWTSTSFTTPAYFSNFAVAIVPGQGNKAIFSWTENGFTPTEWQLCINGDEENLISMTSNPFTYDGLTPDVSTTAKMRAFVGDATGAWSNPVTFKPTDAYSITVYEGTENETSSYIPMYGGYFDDFTKSECIIPATELGTMQWGQITSITFYAKSVSTTNSTWANTNQKVFVKEVNSTTLGGSYSGMDGATVVFDGLLPMPTTSTDGYTITFSQPYTYTGGNLLIGVYNDDDGSYNGVTWYGTTGLTSGVSAYGYNNSSLASVDYTAQSFLPKTTFNYTPGEEPDCFPVSGLSFANVDHESAKLSWTASESNETAWKLQYRKDGTTEWTTVSVLAENLVNGAYPLTGLQSNTPYNWQVAAWCDTDNDEAISTYTAGSNFTTECEAISDLPLVTFDDYSGTSTSSPTNNLPDCWNYLNTNTSSNNGYPVIYNSESSSYSGNNHLRFYTYSYADEYAILPKMESLEGMRITFYARYYNYMTNLIVGVMSNPNDASTFVPKETINDLTTTYKQYKVDFSGLETDQKYIALKMSTSYSNSYYIYVDDITVAETPACEAPESVTVSATTAHGFTATLTPGTATQNQWCYYWSTENVAPGNVNMGTTQTTTFTVDNNNNLLANTDYYLWVGVYCEVDQNYYWCAQPATFKTKADCFDMEVTTITFADITFNSATINWTPVGDATQWRVEYSTSPDFSTTTGYNTEANSWAIEGALVPEQTYYVRVAPYCELVEQYTPWSTGTFTFTTEVACPAPVLNNPTDITAHGATFYWTGSYDSYDVMYRVPAHTLGFSEPFNSSTRPTGWTTYKGLVDDVVAGIAELVENTATNYQNWRMTTYALGSYNATCNTFGTTLNNWLITPEINIAEGYTFSFDLALTDYGNSDPVEDLDGQLDDRFVVLVYADNAWTILREWNNETGSTYVYNDITNEKQTVSDISLSAYVGKTVKIAFYGESTESNGDNDLHIDNVTIGIAVPATAWAVAAANVEGNTVTVDDPTIFAGSTSYEVEVVATCNNVNPSVAVESNVKSFTTDIACPAPTALQTVEGTLKSNQVGLSWTNGGAEDWVLAYKKTADENFTEVNLATADVTIEGTTVTYTLTGLDESTPYTVKVRDNCEASVSGDGLSEWTTELPFSTTAACVAMAPVVSDITHYTATVNWSGESADGFTVKYRTAAGTGAEFSENFEKGIGSWTMVNCHNSTGLNSSVNHTEGGSQCFRFYYRSNPPQYLISPELTGNIDGKNLEFYYKQYDNEWPETFKVGYSNTTSSTDAFTFGDEITMSDTDWHLFSEAVPSGTKYICIQYTSDNQYYLYIDDITIGAYEVPAGTTQTVAATATTANLEGLTAGQKYDLWVVPNCDETLASDIIQFTTVSGNIKWFITEGNWDVDANWEPAGTPTIEQDVVLKADATIASGEAFAKSIAGTGTGDDAKTLTIESGAKLKHLNSSVRATVKKHINSYTNYTGEGNGGYYLIANPMTSSVTPSAENGFLVGNYDLYSWSYDASDGNEWRNYEAGTFTDLNSGAYSSYGYLYANEAGTDLTYTGTINAYTSYKYRSASVATNPDSYSFPSWYLLGNPYLYDAYLANSSSNGTALPYIKMNADGDGFEAVAAGTPIEPMQGFFYQGVTGATTAYVVTYEPTVQDEGKLNMNLRKGNKQLDNAILVFGGEQQMSKMTFRANSSKIYMPVEGKDYAIVSAESNVGEMPVNFKAEKDGSYTLSFTSQEVSFSYLHLIDNMTGADVDLLANPSYTFNALTTDYASRFRLVFATGSSIDGDSFGFINGAGNLNIFGIEGEATVQVIDVLGHVISSETFSGSYERKLNVAPGVYMIRLIQGNDVKVQKIVVR